MKEWNNPELLSLGVENTFDCFDTSLFKPGENNGTHYCHQTGKDHNPPDNGKPEGDPPISHTRSTKCEVHWDHQAQYSKCCCAS